MPDRKQCSKGPIGWSCDYDKADRCMRCGAQKPACVHEVDAAGTCRLCGVSIVAKSVLSGQYPHPTVMATVAELARARLASAIGLPPETAMEVCVERARELISNHEDTITRRQTHIIELEADVNAARQRLGKAIGGNTDSMTLEAMVDIVVDRDRYADQTTSAKDGEIRRLRGIISGVSLQLARTANAPLECSLGMLADRVIALADSRAAELATLREDVKRGAERGAEREAEREAELTAKVFLLEQNLVYCRSDLRARNGEIDTLKYEAATQSKRLTDALIITGLPAIRDAVDRAVARVSRLDGHIQIADLTAKVTRLEADIAAAKKCITGAIAGDLTESLDDLIGRLIFLNNHNKEEVEKAGGIYERDLRRHRKHIATLTSEADAHRQKLATALRQPADMTMATMINGIVLAPNNAVIAAKDEQIRTLTGNLNMRDHCATKYHDELIQIRTLCVNGVGFDNSTFDAVKNVLGEKDERIGKLQGSRDEWEGQAAEWRDAATRVRELIDSADATPESLPGAVKAKLTELHAEELRLRGVINDFAGQVTELKEQPTLRDYFASSVVIGLLADGRVAGNEEDELSKRSYIVADAMLAQRAAKETK